MARWLTLLGFLGLILVVCASAVFGWSEGQTQLGYIVSFVLITTGALLENPKALSRSEGPLLRKPFRYLTGFITALCAVTFVGVIFVHLRGEENLIAAMIFIAGAGFVAGWLTITGFFPFRTR